jgi:hypothetical protein
MTHITEARVIGSHADMGGSAPAVARIPPAVARIPMTVPDILHAGRPRTLGRREMIANTDVSERMLMCRYAVGLQ